jgi:sulfatase modifying factor 1
MGALTDKMRWIPEGSFLMGSEEFYPEERPVHRVTVDGFWMDEHPVTAADFRRFVRGSTPMALPTSEPPYLV